jgi:aminoglycoside phosphotransferase (APT) family kinase protein
MQSERRSRFRAKELAIVMSHYDVGAIREIHSFRRGNIHSPKSVIHTDSGKYLLKRLAPGLGDPDRVRLAHDVQHYLTEQDYPLPKLMVTREYSHTMLATHGSIYELYEFIEGQSYQGLHRETQSAAESLDRLNKFLSDFTSGYDVPSRSYHHADRVRESLGNILPGISKHDSVSRREGQLQEICADLLTSYEKAGQMAICEPERAICHGDWHPGNMLFRDQRVCATFDFDSIRRMSPWEDVANGCLQFSLIAKGREPEAWPAEMDVDRASWFLLGYRDSSVWDRERLAMLAGLMIEALIAESVTPIAVTGRFAHIQGFRFLQMIQRKVHWLERYALESFLEVMDQ